MTLDLNGLTDAQLAYRMACLQGDIYQWCRRVRNAP